MRYLKIFLLSFQDMLAERSRLLVWILVGAISPLILLLFWRGSKGVADWSPNEISSYYFLIIVASAFLISHHEERIAEIDIQAGGLTAYLIKPFSYLQLRFFGEMPYRIFQGTIGIVLLVIFIFLFPGFFTITKVPQIFLLSFCIAIEALLIGFLMKSVIGILAFWMTDMRGAFEAMEVLFAIFSGVLMPLAFLPHWLEKVAYMLPFAYIIYFPVVAFEGKLTLDEIFHVIGAQFFWIILFYILYQTLWREGVKKYTGVGQ